MMNNRETTGALAENLLAIHNSLTHLSYRSCVDAIEDVLGQNGKNSVLRFAGLAVLIEDPVDYDNETRVPYEYVSKLFLGVRDMLGDRGYEAVMYRGGIFAVKNVLKHSEALRNLVTMEFDPIEKLKLGYQAYVRNAGYDPEKTLEYLPDQHQIVVNRPDCAECDALLQMTNKSPNFPKPSCAFIRGLLQSIGECFERELAVTVVEEKCRLVGHDQCQYRVTYSLK